MASDKTIALKWFEKAAALQVAGQTQIDDLEATRLFVGPSEYPPERFAAYGLVAFGSKAVATSEGRYRLACEAYVSAITNAQEVRTPYSSQMVTVWPVETDKQGIFLSRPQSDLGSACESAVKHYDLRRSIEGMKQARIQTKMAFDGEGPYLIAWSPATDRGKSDVAVLVADLSGATTSEQFREYFRHWRNDVESKPELWRNGWSVEKVRLVVRDWADKWGPAILSIAAGSK